jgi:Myb-like DNA-binding domain
VGLAIGSLVLKFWIPCFISNIFVGTVARNVSPHATAAQCQNRWSKSLDPALRRGNWTEEDDDRLRKAVAGYGSSWVQVATAIPGRTNDQCRLRWDEYVNSSTEKSTWTEAEDKMLLENVKLIGSRWKAISLKMGNNRTGPAVSPHVCDQIVSFLRSVSVDCVTTN